MIEHTLREQYFENIFHEKKGENLVARHVLSIFLTYFQIFSEWICHFSNTANMIFMAKRKISINGRNE